MSDSEKWLKEACLADSWWGIALLFLLFAYFFLGSLGYGSLLRVLWRKSNGLLESLTDTFLFSSALLWALATALSSLQLLQRFPVWGYWLAFFPGFIAALVFLREPLRSAKTRAPYFFALFIFVFLLRALSAALPARHGDPLLYHLLGPRLWVEAGGFEMHSQLPNALLASSWEMLYVWPQLLWFSTRPLFGLVEAHIFSQWSHLFFAWAGSALLVMRLFQPSLAISRLPIVGLAALFVSGLHWTAPLAKNDVGIAFWALGAIVYFIDAFRKKSKPHALFSGFFTGLAVSGKVTALLTLGPLLLVLLISTHPWRDRRFFFRSIPFWSTGLLAGALPIYLRNYFLSGNPFFPLFHKFFPSPFLSPSFEAHFAQVHPSNPIHSLPRIWLRAPELWKESPFILLAIVLLVFVIFAKGRMRTEAAPPISLLVGSFLAYVLFVITQSVQIELRYLGASLQILAGGGAVLLLQWAGCLPSAKLRSGAMFFIIAAILAASKLPLHIVSKIWKERLGVAYVATHTAGEAKAWLRKNANADFTVMVGDNESYYLTPVAHAVLTERSDLDRATRDEKIFSRFVASLCELAHTKYLFDTRPENENGIGRRFGLIIPTSALAFSAQGANIYDLKKLEAIVSPNARACRH